MSDKTINLCLLKILTERKLKNIPIVCITNIDILRKMGDIKKICKIYELTSPTHHDIANIMKGVPKKRVKQIYHIANGNLLKIFQNDLTRDQKDVAVDVVELYDNSFNRDHMRHVLDTDVWLIPLRFHENLITELANRNVSYAKKKEFYKLFIRTLCYYDQCMCNNNTEIAVDIFVSILYFLCILKYRKNHAANMDNFTKILSYLSLQKKYIKYSYSSDFPLYQIRNYHTTLLNRKFIYFN